MKNVTVDFLNSITTVRNFSYRVTMDFASGTRKVLNDLDDLMTSGCEIRQSAETSSFPLGNAIGKSLVLALPNQDDRWSEFDFFGCQIKVELLHEKLDTPLVLGYFTIISPETYGSTVEVTAVDKMYKADKPFDETRCYANMTLLQLLEMACTQCGLQYQGAHFLNDSYQIAQVPKNQSCRQIIGMVAQLACGNAVINDYGTVSIVTYSMQALRSVRDYDGGTFNTTTTPYSDGDSIDGGDFTFSEGTNYDGGNFEELRNYHVLYKGSKITLSTDDVIITGIQTVINEVVYPTGYTQVEGYILNITNELLNGNSEASINSILHAMMFTLCYNSTRNTGLRFRIFDIDHVSYPVVEFADCCKVVDRKGRVYNSIVTDITFAFKGYTTIKCTAEAPMRNASKYRGAEVAAIIAAKEMVEREKTEREVAIRNTEELIQNSPGLYLSVVDNLPGVKNPAVLQNTAITFSPLCTGESATYDWVSLYVFDRDNGTVLGAAFEKQRCNDLAGKTFIVPDGNIRIHWRTDGSAHDYYGWKIDSVTKTTDDAILLTSPQYYPSSVNNNYVDVYETPHNPYLDNTNDFYTISVGRSGSQTPKIRVLHDKKTLAESQILWVATRDVFYVSTDGGRSFNASLDATGNAILNKISAIGINADWINTGDLNVGGSGKCANIIVRDASDNIIGTWNKNGLQVGTGKVSGLRTSDLYNNSDFQTSYGVNQLITEKVTASFINALCVVAGSVAAENITGETISGKTVKVGGYNSSNGKITLYNSSGEDIGIWDDDGLILRAQPRTSSANERVPFIKLKNGGIVFGYRYRNVDYESSTVQYKRTSNKDKLYFDGDLQTYFQGNVYTNKNLNVNGDLNINGYTYIENEGDFHIAGRGIYLQRDWALPIGTHWGSNGLDCDSIGWFNVLTTY